MERRHFIQTATLAAAGLYAQGVFGAFPGKTNLGVQLYSVRDAIAKDLEGSLEQLASIGYKYVELYGYDGTFFGRSAKTFQTILANVGLTATSSHHNTGLLVKANGTLSQNWEKAVADAHQIGIQYLVCAYLFPEERTEVHYLALPDLLHQSGQKAQAAGIQFAYHNHDFEFAPLGDTLAYDFLLKNTNANVVAMELDLYWITKAGYDPLAYFDKYPGRFPLWHVKDMETGTGDFAAVGQGTVNFDRIFAKRKQAGLKHWFVEQDVSKGDIFESLKWSRDFVVGKGY